MSLARATHADGSPIQLPGEPPYRGSDLYSLLDLPFELPCDDPWVRGRGTVGHTYLDGARDAWVEEPEWMDFLDLSSPAADVKRAARDVYRHWWRPWIGPGKVLDVGCGIGRWTAAFLDRGADVWAVDPDLESLRRCAWHAAGRAGRLDLHWSSVEVLPPGPFDVAVACEVLCYVPEYRAALDRIVERLRPGGVLLLSVEARWGWAASPDASSGALDAALGGDGVVHVAGDRWVKTFEEDELRALLTDAGLEVELLVPTHYVAEGPLEHCAGSCSLEDLLAAEERCRRHPVWAPLHRVWTAVGVKKP